MMIGDFSILGFKFMELFLIWYIQV